MELTPSLAEGLIPNGRIRLWFAPIVLVIYPNIAEELIP